MATQPAFHARLPQLALLQQPGGGDRAVAPVRVRFPGAVGSQGAKAVAVAATARARRGVWCRASLIEPDGGRLVDLVAPEEGSRREALRREAAALPHRVRLGRVDKEWVHVLSEGWASPLRGFMREAEFLQALHFNAIRGRMAGWSTCPSYRPRHRGRPAPGHPGRRRHARRACRRPRPPHRRPQRH